MRVLAYSILFVLLFSGCIGSDDGGEWSKACFEDGFCVKLEVMRENEERQQGLMYREKLAEDTGMFFVFPRAQPYSFWMKNMRFPIDMIWLDENFTVVYVEANVPLCASDPCPSYTPKASALYVLEVNANQALEHGVYESSQITIT